MKMINLDPRVDDVIIWRAGEQKVLEVPKHWASLLAPMIRMIFGLFLCILAKRLEGNWYWWVLFLGWVIVFEAAWRHLQVYRDRFVVTTTRIFRVTGVRDTQRNTIPIGRIIDSKVRRGWFGNWLNYGHLRFKHLNYEDAGIVHHLEKIKFIRDIDHVEQVLRIITTKKKLDQAYEDWTADEIRDVINTSDDS